MKNCYIYLRVSTDEQAQQGFSIDNQKRACTEYAQMRGFHVKQVFLDDGKSARTTERAALQEMLKAISKLRSTNKVEAVIIYKIDRFARNVADFSKMFMEFKANDIKLISVNEGDLTEGTSLIPNIFASVAQWESEVNSQRTKDALMQKFREGWQPTPPPIGYRSVGGERERKTCEPDPYVAPVIKDLFELYSTGNYSIFELQSWLAEQNITSRNGTPLGHSVIGTILNNPFYYGLIRWHGESKTGNHQPIISKDLYDTCQYVSAKHRNFLMRKRKHQFLLRGFMYCSECGQRYTAEWHRNEKKFKHRGGKIGYYHCPKLGRNGCPAPYVEIDELENQMQELFNRIEFSEEFVQAVSTQARNYLNNSREQASSDMQGCVNQKTALETKRNKLEDALLDGTIERDVFKRKHEDIQAQLNLIQDRMEEVENRSRIDLNIIDEILAFTRNVGEAYEDAEFYLKRHYLRFFFDKVLIKNSQIEEVKYPPIIASLQALSVVIIRNEMLRLVDVFCNRKIEFGFSLQNIKTVFETLQIQPAYL